MAGRGGCVLGTVVALLPNRRAVLVLASAHEQSTATQTVQPGLTPSVIRREGTIKCAG